MHVMNIVRLATDRYHDGPTGKVIAVRGGRDTTVTVIWLDGVLSDHPAETLVLETPKPGHYE